MNFDTKARILAALPGKDAGHLAEEDMTSLGAAAKACKVHCVGHGHTDMNWMWSWPKAHNSRGVKHFYTQKPITGLFRNV